MIRELLRRLAIVGGLAAGGLQAGPVGAQAAPRPEDRAPIGSWS